MPKSDYKERTIICKGCGEKVTDNFRPNQEYCSLACYRHSKHPQKKNGKTVECEWCGKKVYKPKCYLEKANHYFCSIECLNKWQGRNKVEFECEVCGKKFRLPKSRAESDNPRFCSVECRDKSDEWDGNSKGGLAVAEMDVSPTSLELKGRKLLNELGFELGKDFKERTTINDKFNVDVLFLNKKLVIEWDGDYWHGHPSEKPLNDHQKYIIQRDNSQDKYLQECGFKVLRFWGSEVREKPNMVKKKIKGAFNDN